MCNVELQKIFIINYPRQLWSYAGIFLLGYKSYIGNKCHIEFWYQKYQKYQKYHRLSCARTLYIYYYNYYPYNIKTIINYYFYICSPSSFFDANCLILNIMSKQTMILLILLILLIPFCVAHTLLQMLKCTMHTFAILCKMPIPRNYFYNDFNIHLTAWYLACYLLSILTVCRSITSARWGIASAR
jgi:hypothetical protein